MFGGIWVLYSLGGRRTIVARRGDKGKHRAELVLGAKAHGGVGDGEGGGGAVLVQCEAGAAVDPAGKGAGGAPRSMSGYRGVKDVAEGCFGGGRGERDPAERTAHKPPPGFAVTRPTNRNAGKTKTNN